MRHQILSTIIMPSALLLCAMFGGSASARDDSMWERPARPVQTQVVAVANLNIVAPQPARRRAAPDLGTFDSVAISSRSLPAAAKWRGVKSSATSALDLCNDGYDCVGLALSLRLAAEKAAGQTPVAQLKTINAAVNQALTYGSDRSVWGTSDYWATPVEIVARGRGDCEDYAILKYWMLRDAGFAAEQLQLVVLRDTRRDVYHAVLTVHLAGTRYVLDNLAGNVRTDRSFGSYMPIMSFVGDKSYIHGFRNKRSEVAAMPTNYADIAPGEGY